MPTRVRRPLRTADCLGLRVVSLGDCTSVIACVLGALLLGACLSAQTTSSISRADWGTTVRGERVAIYTLAGAGGLEARISDFCGVIVTLNVPNRNGSKTDVMLGYDDLASYEKGGVYGSPTRPIGRNSRPRW